MLIWGFRARWTRRKGETGTFFCPNCGGDRSWVRVVLRRWFTFFFIPMIPGKVREEAGECQTCSKKWKSSVLAKPTSADLAARMQGACQLAAIAVLRSGDENNVPARVAAVDAVRRNGTSDYDDETLSHDLTTLDTVTLDERLAFVAPSLETPGKELLLGSLARIASDGGFASDAEPTLQRLGSGLGLTAAHIAGVIAKPLAAVLPPPPGFSPLPASSGTESSSGTARTGEPSS